MDTQFLTAVGLKFLKFVQETTMSFLIGQFNHGLVVFAAEIIYDSSSRTHSSNYREYSSSQIYIPFYSFNLSRILLQLNNNFLSRHGFEIILKYKIWLTQKIVKAIFLFCKFNFANLILQITQNKFENFLNKFKIQNYTMYLPQIDHF